MAIPAPKKSEAQEDYVDRCMADDTMGSDYPDDKQRAAVCYSTWRKKRGAGAKSSVEAKTQPWFTMKKAGGDTAEIVIYDEIGPSFFSDDKNNPASAKGFVNTLKALGDVKNIRVRINSPGGSAIDGLAIYNLLNGHDAHVEMIVDGIAASAASLIVMAGDHIVMPDNTFMLVHNPRGVAMGEPDDMRKAAEQLDTLRDSFAKIYADRTGLTVDAVKSLMDEDCLMGAAEAHRTGFADEVTSPVQAKATFDLSKLPPGAQAVCKKFMAQTDPPQPEVDKDKEASMATQEEIAAAEKAAADKKAADDKAAADKAAADKAVVDKAAKDAADKAAADAKLAADELAKSKMSGEQTKEIYDLCTLAGYSNKLSDFVDDKMVPKMSVPDVRKKLLEMRALDDERLNVKNQRVDNTSNSKTADGQKKASAAWKTIIDKANARMGGQGRTA